MNELEQRKQKYDIVFYCMAGCYHCQMANSALEKEINSGIVGKFAHTDDPPPGIQGFPHFVNNKNGKTVTGWPRTKDELFLQLDYKETFWFKPDMKKEGFSENFEMESIPSYNVLEPMETIPADVPYHHNVCGYSKLSNCWVKRPDYTV